VTILALATLVGTAKNRNDTIFVMPPKVTKASAIVTVMCHCHQHFYLKNITNVHDTSGWLTLAIIALG
jgi:hypothetical protein